jgi:branched-chain amino acid transport system substrate-binding protein
MAERIFLFLRKLSATALVLCACSSLLSCIEDPPLKIGFVAGLTGRVADLGVASRDAVTLAIEEQNMSGGISGRQLELVVRDDQQDAEALKQAVRELVDEEVSAIIGPVTSSMAVTAQPLINANQIVMVSPTAKTDQLSGKDDFFFRVTAPVSKNAEQLADYVTKDINLPRFAVVYDLSNRAFTETWLNSFKNTLEKNGGQVVAVEEFTSQPEVHFLPLAKRVLEAEPDGVLLLSSAIDTALLSQQIRKLESSVALFSSEWASTTDLLSFGGRAVIGMRSFHSFNANSQEPRYLAFKEKFTQRFGYVPSFVTVLSYDAASHLFAGLARKTDEESLKTALLGIGRFPGLQSEMTFDRYGDVERKLFLTVIENGQFKVVDKL